MTTLATNGSIRNPKLTVTLALSINHQVYTVTPIDHNDDTITRAFRLKKKHDGTLYDVCQGEHGATCDCPDFEVRRNGIDPEGCKHIKALRMMGMLDAASVAKGVVIADAPAVEPEPARRRMPEGYCSKCARIGFMMKADAVGDMVCWDCRQEACHICERVGTRRVERRDGIVICPECSKRNEEKAELQAFLAAPAPVACCDPTEQSPCVACETSTPVVDVAPEPEPINQPAPIVDAYPDEAPELDFEPSDADRLAVAEWVNAADVQRYLDRSAELPLVESLDHVAAAFKAWGNPFGSFLSDIMEELSQKAFMTGATTPHELRTGIESLDREARETWERLGFANGKAAAGPKFDVNSPEARAVLRGNPTAGYAGGNVLPSAFARH